MASLTFGNHIGHNFGWYDGWQGWGSANPEGYEYCAGKNSGGYCRFVVSVPFTHSGLLTQLTWSNIPLYADRANNTAPSSTIIKCALTKTAPTAGSKGSTDPKNYSLITTSTIAYNNTTKTFNLTLTFTTPIEFTAATTLYLWLYNDDYNTVYHIKTANRPSFTYSYSSTTSTAFEVQYTSSAHPDQWYNDGNNIRLGYAKDHLGSMANQIPRIKFKMPEDYVSGGYYDLRLYLNPRYSNTDIRPKQFRAYIFDPDSLPSGISLDGFGLGAKLSDFVDSSTNGPSELFSTYIARCDYIQNSDGSKITDTEVFNNQGGANNNPPTYSFYLDFNLNSVNGGSANVPKLQPDKEYYIYFLPYIDSIGFTFNGGLWFEGSAYTNYASFILDDYAINVTVSLDSQAKDITVDSIEVVYKSTYETLPEALERRGYSFQGWYTASNGGTKITPSTIVNIKTNHTLYAHWYPHSYTITYNANGGTTTNSTPQQRVVYDSTFTVNDGKTYSKTGYLFKGWTTKNNGEDDGYNWGAGQTYTWTYISGDYGIQGSNVTLYARWEPITYTIVFDNNGGTFNQSLPVDSNTSTKKISDAKYDTNYILTANGYKRAGFKFKHWGLNKEGTDVTYADRATVSNLTTEDGDTVTLYAIWEPNTVSIYRNNTSKFNLYEIMIAKNDGGPEQFEQYVPFIYDGTKWVPYTGRDN